ncbi:MAG: thermonuclease family protein [Paracoccaceae bacterium]
MLTVRSLLVLVVLLLAAPFSIALTRDGSVRVIDGDTLDWQGKRVRLFGIDAPEKRQTCDRNGQSWDCGAWSATMLSRAVQSGAVTCIKESMHRNRIVATCTAAGQDLSLLQIQAGAAQAYRRYSDRYVPAEQAARAGAVGIWAGRMVTPEAYRHTGKATVQIAPADCLLKGNINGSNRIYHRPGQRDYAATRIDPSKGEAWFCTENDAVAAGFRPARR